ncbi:hypothetical protein [Tetragenococcus halophilus]|uniref:Uncharacterized protein n=1 Tax=Tetragenococcus halophilus (strain DSM 20338 / JCM 20259 / NCIMB 9735 / NBRC 12172) TaxID=945021 RepID=A0AAN1SGP3_TETHN|nr:hypothetical protein [Tetragenococcus halophilus]BAK94191.1 hypothetical protein TEH_08640 [Tetragenococcus halophilus NBRC 12172]GBD70760.1 putative uncharacterized protein [Tetragenococcus halophilus subsp. halophilus]
MGAIFKRGGIVPEMYGLSLTVYADEKTTEGQPLVFDAEAGDYGVKIASQGERPDAVVKVGDDAGVPISAYVVTGGSRNAKVEVEEAVQVGDTVVASSNGIFEKESVSEGAEAKGLYVLKGNENNTAEVLI